MNTRILLTLVLSPLFLNSTVRANEDNSPTLVQVERGSAAFKAESNMPGVEIRGTSSTLSGIVNVERSANGELVLQQVSASLPIASLTTGIRLRDEHMRKYIFTAGDGRVPDLQFKTDRAICAATAVSHEFECRLSGAFTIRGIPRALSLHLHVKEQPALAGSFRVSADAVVNLNDYGIEPPSQFGVRPSSKVNFHADFTGRQRPFSTSGGGASR